MNKCMKTALLAYGMSGKVFHAPFLHLHPGFQLAGAWERSKQQIGQDYENVQSYPSLEAVLQDSSIELVVVNTPTFTHYDYTKQALLAGKHAIVEKAFTTTVAEAEELKTLAEAKNLKLSVFQNRRWDSDFKTVQKIFSEGILGPITEAEFHFDRFNPAPGPKLHKELPGPGAGILKDLGAHIIDQALCLFGVPESVFGDIRITRPGSQVDDYFEILLYYPTMRVRLKAGYLVREPVPSYQLHGMQGSFLKSRADKQEADSKAGKKPGAADWGVEPDSESGLLHTETGGKIIREKVETEQGNYYDYYEGVYRAIVDNTPLPVSAQDGVNVMRVIEAAIKSSAEGRIVAWSNVKDQFDDET